MSEDLKKEISVYSIYDFGDDTIFDLMNIVFYSFKIFSFLINFFNSIFSILNYALELPFYAWYKASDLVSALCDIYWNIFSCFFDYFYLYFLNFSDSTLAAYNLKQYELLMFQKEFFTESLDLLTAELDFIPRPLLYAYNQILSTLFTCFSILHYFYFSFLNFRDDIIFNFIKIFSFLIDFFNSTFFILNYVLELPFYAWYKASDLVSELCDIYWNIFSCFFDYFYLYFLNFSDSTLVAYHSKQYELLMFQKKFFTESVDLLITELDFLPKPLLYVYSQILDILFTCFSILHYFYFSFLNFGDSAFNEFLVKRDELLFFSQDSIFWINVKTFFYFFKYYILLGVDYIVLFLVTIVRSICTFIVFSQNSFLYYFLLFILTNVISLFFLSYLGIYGVFIINLISLFLFWISSLYVWTLFLNDSNKIIIWNLGSWILLNFKYKVEFLFYFDNLSFSFMLLTVTISFFVYIYTFSYFRYEPHVERLLIFLNLFVISMIILVIAGNMIILFLGWELIGLTSFFLINFWNTRVSTLKSAFKAFFFNRFSDIILFFLCIFIFYLFNDCTHTVIINLMLNKTNFFINGFNIIDIFSLLIIIPICIKSAQVICHVWLPDSMEAPVPASALIHSATLVSAGIYLILRFKSIICLSMYATTLLILIGTFTAVLGAVSSAHQTDVKKILAYSTISHCGFLVLSAIICDVEYTILYLFIHGFFKAASFICIGNVIRFNYGFQDIRSMGGYAKYLPFETNALGICLLFLAGAPFTFGFFMKHFLMSTLNVNSYFITFMYVLIFIAALFGTIYCSRLYYGIFFGPKKSNKHVYTSVSRKNFFYFDSRNSYYTNSTLGSIFAIFGLIFFGTLISFLYMLFLYMKFYNLGDFSTLTTNKSYFSLKEYTPIALLFNFGFINIIVIFIILFITIISLIWIFNYENIFELLSYILIFLVFFSFFFFLIILYILNVG